jgi:hypothetical protein
MLIDEYTGHTFFTKAVTKMTGGEGLWSLPSLGRSFYRTLKLAVIGNLYRGIGVTRMV